MDMAYLQQSDIQGDVIRYRRRKIGHIDRAVKAAQFRYNASVDEIGYIFERGLDRNQVERLASLEFVRENKDLFITGSTKISMLSGHSPRIQSLHFTGQFTPFQIGLSVTQHR